MTAADLSDSKPTPVWLKRVLLIVFLLVPVVNFGVFLLPGGDQQFADMTRTRVDAAGYAFSIWGFIFAAMIAFSVAAQRTAESSRSLTIAIRSLIVAGIASILFVPISLYASQTVGWFDIITHLLALVTALVFLRRHCAAMPGGGRRWSFIGPSMYCGWISAATVISTALMLQEIGVEVSEQLATVITCTVLGTITTIGCLMIASRDPVYGATIAWALIAVGVQQSAYPPIRWTAWTGAAVIVICCVLFAARTRSFYATTNTPHLDEE